MGLNHGWRGPNIVRDGLVLYLDAGSPNSYQGIGTIWKDISKVNQNNGTLINGPTFNSGNNGSIVFDGTNDYVNLGDSDLFSFTSGGGVDLPFTIGCWVRLNAYGSGAALYFILLSKSRYLLPGGWTREWIFGHTNSSGILVTLFVNDFNSIGKTVGSPLSLNTWNYCVCTYNGNETVGGLSIYINGILQSTSNITAGTYTGMSNTTVPVEIGRQNNTGGDSGYLNGNISSVQLYNRALTPSEVLQNYNATKGRFGL
jgi:hypothetical protein